MADPGPPGDNLPEIDALWNYADPEATEKVFRSLLPTARRSDDPDYLIQLLTQIARAHSLQLQFAESHALLDEAESLLTDDLVTARVRYLLERGRAFNSEGRLDEARPLFTEAWNVARGNHLDYYAVDAAYMLGILETGDLSLEWNEKAIDFAEAASEERTREWLGPLYNNAGWTYHDIGNYGPALELFEKSLAWYQDKKREPGIRIARWAIARTYRSLGRVDQALAAQHAIVRDYPDVEDGYVSEEIAECLVLLGRASEAAPHFARAHELLSQDGWLV